MHAKLQLLQRTCKVGLLLIVCGALIEAASRLDGATKLRTARPLTWSSFHLHAYQYVGLWENQQYQAEIWIKPLCHNQTHNVLRMLVSIHQAPFINTNAPSGAGPHSETPTIFRTNTGIGGGSILPKVWFESPAGARTYATGLQWDAYRTRVSSTAMMAAATLHSNVFYTVGIQGSERVHQLPARCTSNRHHLFADNAVWLGITEVNIASSRQKMPAGSQPLFLIDTWKNRHQMVHREPASNTSIDRSQQAGLNSAALKAAYSRHTNSPAVDVSATKAAAHEAGLVDNSSQSLVRSAPSINSKFVSMRRTLHMTGIQPPIHNSTRDNTLSFLVLQHLRHHLALGFSGAIMVVTPHTANSLMRSKPLLQHMHSQHLILVLWDSGLEARASHFIQIPANNLLRLVAWGSSSKLALFDLDEYLVLPKHRKVTQEITQGCLNGALTGEAIIPSSWARSTTRTSQPDVYTWMQHRSWRAAVSAMKYEILPYTFCDGVCKAVIDPNLDLIFQVHQYEHPVHKPVQGVSRSCAYLLHFHNLHSIRQPTVAYAGGRGAPLKLLDLQRPA